MSRVTAIISALVMRIIDTLTLPWHCLIITVITPLPTKPSATNARELKLANAAITDMQMRQRDVAALDAKYTKELADAKLKMMLCVMVLPLVVVVCRKQSVSQCVKPPPPRVDNAASPTGRHR